MMVPARENNAKPAIHSISRHPCFVHRGRWRPCARPSRPRCWARTSGSSPSATSQAIVKTTERARLPPASGKCKACKAGGDGLLACSFCTAIYHNSEACLGEAQVANEALAKSASFLWACPTCFKKGVTAVQRAALKPTGQRAAGAKKPRKKRAKK